MDPDISGSHALMRDAVHTSETSVYFIETTLQYMSKGYHLCSTDTVLVINRIVGCIIEQ
jgi:hypothetical protein